MLVIRDEKDVEKIVEIAQLLWNKYSKNELKNEIAKLLKAGTKFFLCYENEKEIGFAQCQFRNEYVEGAKTTPVAYLEGIFIKEEKRGKGYSKKLLEVCEQWALSMNCYELASDCILDNLLSIKFHRDMGFKETNKIVCFIKRLKVKERRDDK